jgi:hypothetical protein
MKHTHPNLPGVEIEIYSTGVQSRAGGSFYQFHLVREPVIKMDLCKNLKSDEEAIKYFDSIYAEKAWVDALLYPYNRHASMKKFEDIVRDDSFELLAASVTIPPEKEVA